jgi:hypothetical protein
VKNTPDKTPSTILVIYNAILAPVLKLMDKMSGRDVAADRKAKKVA